MAKSSAKRANSKAAAAVESISELARLVDRDVGTVSRWLRRDDWPFPKKPPFQRSLVPRILRWVADTLLARESTKTEPQSGDESDDTPALRKDKLRKEIRKLNAQADAAETALARERGSLLDAGEVETEWAAMGAMVRRGFQNLGSQLVPLALTHGLPHEAAPEFQSQAESLIAGILKQLSSGRAENDTNGEGEVPRQPVPAGKTDAGGVGREISSPQP